MSEWRNVAFCMKYKVEEVNAFWRDSKDLQECCTKLFENWVSTDHGPMPKTYKTLLNHIKEVEMLKAVSEEIEEELIKGKG